MQNWTLITGVGPGTGSALARRFAAGGDHVALLARNQERLDDLSAELSDSGLASSVHPTDVSDLGQLRSTCAALLEERGAPRVVIHNAVGGAFGTYDKVTAEVLERNFRINTTAFLVLAQELAPAMEERVQSGSSGTILATGNTSAWRGKANFTAFAATKAAQRILAQSLARTLGPRGVHVAYIVIDAVIDVPWARKAMPDQPNDFFIQPADIADAAFALTQQPRSAWTFELDLRPYKESW